MLGSASRRLDDMLSMPFSLYIINYELSRGFMVPKFMTFDGTSDLFNHIMHYRQLMALDIGNDTVMQSLSSQPARPGSFMVPPSSKEFREQFLGYVRSLCRTLLIFGATQA